MMIDDTDIMLKHPFCMTIAGPSQCGKTNYVIDLLLQNKERIYPSPTKIFYCYAVWQNSYDRLKENLSEIEFNEGLPILDNIDSNEYNLFILDDLMDECGDNKNILHLFTVGSHHKNSSVIFMTQNIFSKGKYTRSLNLNSHYLVLFNNLRDRSQVTNLARQLYPNNCKFFDEVFQDSVCSKMFGHLLIDLEQNTPENLRLRSYDETTKKIYVYIKN